MKTSSAHSDHSPGLFHQRQGFIVVLMCVFLLISAGSLLAANAPFTHIPTKPSAKTLSHINLKPDLAVTNITFDHKGENRVEATITIKNVGTASSHATRASAVLTRGDGSHAKNSWSVQALKVGATKALTWRISVKPGHNILEVSVKDPNKNGNRLKKDYFLLARPARVLSHSRKQITEGVRKVSKAQAAQAQGRLVVQRVTFDDSKAKKPGKTWVAIYLKNIGKKATPARKFRVQIQRADGTRAWKRFRVRALRPGESARVESFFKMARGENTLKVEGIGGMHRHFPTTFERLSREFIARHTYNPRLIRVAHKNGAELAKNAARVAGGKPAAGEMPNANTMKALSNAKHITFPKPVKTSTYDSPMARFLQPRPPAVIQPNQRCFIEWAWNNPMPDANQRLELHLKSVTDPNRFPDLILARGLDPNTRSYTWDVGNLPTGHLYKLLLYEARTDVVELLTSTEIKIDTPHFGITRKTSRPTKVLVNRKVTLYADVVNTGGDLSQPFYSKVKVTGPDHFVLESPRIKIDSLPHGHTKRLSFTFTPPFAGRYKAVYEPDITHRFTTAADNTAEINRTFNFQVQGLPDLKVFINKVPDGVLGIDKMHFHIRVLNFGTVKSPPTKVYFDLTDQERMIFDVPSLQAHYGPYDESTPKVWKHNFSKRWQVFSGGTGEKHYSVTVDPENRIVEADETNNHISDHFHIYLAGQPMPRHTTTPPTLVVTDMYHLPTAPVSVGTTLHFAAHLKCISPDRIPLHGFRVKILLGNLLADRDYKYGVLYPGEMIMVENIDRHNNIYNYRMDYPRTYTFKMQVSPMDGRDEWHTHWHTVFVRDIIVREKENTHAMQDVLASQNPYRSMGGQSSETTIHPITLLSPGKNKIWSVGRTYQIAWTGKATGPFTVTLIPKDHPNASVQIADNISGHATDYKVKRHLESGLYRVKVQSADGWGISDFFPITDDFKPNLKFKAVSFTNRLSGDPNRPYIIEARFIVENDGGYQSQPFNVLLDSVYQEGSAPPDLLGGLLLPRRELAGILMEPMRDRRTFPGRIRLKVAKGGLHVLKLVADSYDRLDESNEDDNTVVNSRYRVDPYPDLRLACRQEGTKLHFTVKNTGDAISGATSIKLKLKLHGSFGLSLPGWRRQGDYVIAPPIAVKSIGSGKVLEVDSPSLVPFHIHRGDTYVATVNPNRGFQELCYDNNTVAGGWSAAAQSRLPADWWKTAFGVEKHINNNVIVPPCNGNANRRVGLHFGFVLWNKSEIPVTPDDPPIQAVLYLNQKGRDKTFSYDLPPLFSVARSSRRDEYRIDKNEPFLATRGDVSYTLFLKKGNEMVSLASGKVKIRIENGTCGGE